MAAPWHFIYSRHCGRLHSSAFIDLSVCFPINTPQTKESHPHPSAQRRHASNHLSAHLHILFVLSVFTRFFFSLSVFFACSGARSQIKPGWGSALQRPAENTTFSSAQNMKTTELVDRCFFFFIPEFIQIFCANKENLLIKIRIWKPENLREMESKSTQKLRNPWKPLRIHSNEKYIWTNSYSFVDWKEL